MIVSPAPSELIDQMRSWFFAKDRSVYLAEGNFFYLPGGYYVAQGFIAETILTGSVASVTFSNIPQGFRHLVLVSRAREDAAAEAITFGLRINGDSGANYDNEYLQGNSATASATAVTGGTSINIGLSEGASSRANCFGLTYIYLPGYSVAGQEKYTWSLSHAIGNLSAAADLFVRFVGGHWRNTNVITSLTLVPGLGNLVSGSRFQLYGIL